MNIEDFLKEKNTDIHEPDIIGLWNGIEKIRNSKKVRKNYIIKWSAAVLLLALVSGAFIKHELNMQKHITSLSQINSQLAKKEKAYNLKVSTKWTRYSNMPGNESVIAPFLINELKHLDTIYQEGLKNIDLNGINEREIILLLNTYEKRLRIIEQLIYEKEKQANYENKSNKMDI